MAMRNITRRKLLKLASAGGVASTAGCLGVGGGNGGGGSEDYLEAANEMGFTDNWRERRVGIRKDWPIEARRDVPDRSSDTTWEGFESFETAPWTPPEGWDDGPAGDVEKLQILNHGAVNMEFDPATVATHELFERETGIELDPIEIGVDKANTREQQFLSAEKGEPQLFNVDGTLMPLLVQQGWLEVTDPLYSEQVWDAYVGTLRDVVHWDIDPTREGAHAYGFPNILEGTVGNLRPDLVEEQGLDPERFQGEWSWDLLEELMKAFEGTDVSGYAYYAGSPTYLFISFRNLLYQQGGRMVSTDGKVQVDTQAGRKVLEKMHEWRSKGWVPGDVIGYSEGDLVDLFLSGKLAYASAFSDFVPRSLKAYEAGSEYQVVVPPKANTGPNPQQAGVTAPNGCAVNPYAENADKLAGLVYGDARLSYCSQWWELTYEGNMSYMNQVYDDAAKHDFMPFGEVIGESIAAGKIELFPQMQSIFTKIMDPFQSAIVGDMSPAEATEQAQSYIDDVLDQ